jgi:hypothetical protein
MMGRNDKPQKPLFYAFNLDDVVPQDHLLRKIGPARAPGTVLQPYRTALGRSGTDDPHADYRLLPGDSFRASPV